jgi:cytochrome c-type biogenesis protein CcmH
LTNALAIAASALLALSPAVPVTQPQADLADIEDEVMCPICGTLLELSEAPQAERQRDFIRERIARGQTKERIKAALVAEYGDEVLAVPGDEGFDLAAWVVPGIGLLVAAGAIAIGVARWRSGGGDGGQTPVVEPQGEAEKKRLTADLRRYDL